MHQFHSGLSFSYLFRSKFELNLSIILEWIKVYGRLLDILFICIFFIIFTKIDRKQIINMAVPKKRTSKAKKNSRKATWKRKANATGQKALALAKSVLKGQTTSFIYTLDEE